ncbi:MAG: FAD-dependent oxidoreductase [Oscillospiraceae bacterium]|nr:FAD-dependent oxidoreductase [Oscillospiraceae bacterium]
MYDMIIVGGGPAGLTAAIYALRAGKRVVVIEKNSFGGQIAFSPKVENIPGTQVISGAAFAEALTEQTMNLGADVELEKVVSVQKEGDVFKVTTEEGSSFEGRTVILAVGVKHRTLGLPGEEELIGRGISFCAVCDGAFYAGQEVAMIGGGNSALQEALLLSEVCKKVTIVQNLPFFTGEKALADAVLAKENIEVRFGTLVTGYESKEGDLSGLVLRKEETGETDSLSVDGAFLAVGLLPENEAFAELALLDDRGYFETDESCVTKTEGLFVAGDCRCKNIRQVVTACSDGAVAATAAERYLNRLNS